MPSLQELRTQIADLEKQAAEIHDRESQAAIATVTELVEKYGLTAEQVGLGSPAAPAPARKRAGRKPAPKPVRPGAGVPKFADPASGKTWTGFGKPPAWIAGAKDRDAFRIEAASDTQSAAPKPATRKSSRKPKAA